MQCPRPLGFDVKSDGKRDEMTFMPLKLLKISNLKLKKLTNFILFFLKKR
jgi:hypothetical protein